MLLGGQAWGHHIRAWCVRLAHTHPGPRSPPPDTHPTEMPALPTAQWTQDGTKQWYLNNPKLEVPGAGPWRWGHSGSWHRGHCQAVRPRDHRAGSCPEGESSGHTSPLHWCGFRKKWSWSKVKKVRKAIALVEGRWVWFTHVCVFARIHQTAQLQRVRFTICKFYVKREKINVCKCRSLVGKFCFSQW